MPVGGYARERLCLWGVPEKPKCSPKQCCLLGEVGQLAQVRLLRQFGLHRVLGQGKNVFWDRERLHPTVKEEPLVQRRALGRVYTP